VLAERSSRKIRNITNVYNRPVGGIMDIGLGLVLTGENLISQLI